MGLLFQRPQTSISTKLIFELITLNKLRTYTGWRATVILPPFASLSNNAGSSIFLFLVFDCLCVFHCFVVSFVFSFAVVIVFLSLSFALLNVLLDNSDDVPIFISLQF